VCHGCPHAYITAAALSPSSLQNYLPALHVDNTLSFFVCEHLHNLLSLHPTISLTRATPHLSMPSHLCPPCIHSCSQGCLGNSTVEHSQLTGPCCRCPALTIICLCMTCTSRSNTRRDSMPGTYIIVLAVLEMHCHQHCCPGLDSCCHMLPPCVLLLLHHCCALSGARCCYYVRRTGMRHFHVVEASRVSTEGFMQ
jgi:hypothetical protein